MANTYEYIISLQDKMSGTMHKITGTSDTMVTKLESMSKQAKELQGVSKDLGGSLFTLKQKIDLLQKEKELIDPSNLKTLKEYNREIAGLEKQINSLDNAGKSQSMFGGLTDKLKGFINPATLITAGVGLTGKSAMNFDEGMAQVNITAQLDGNAFENLKDKIKGIARDNKAVIELAPKGFEQIISQTGEVDLSLEILDAAMKGARGGFVDLSTVSGALAQSLSVIGKENASAIDVLDTFFAAKRVGAGEFADFARYLPGMIAGASNLGIAYKEVAGTYAYMTGKGQSAERAAVLMENAFSVLGKADIRKNMAKAGVKVFDDAGKVRGMVDIFTDLYSVMGGLTDEQKSSLLETFGIVDKEAKNAFALLTADIGKFSDSMTETVNSTGETQKALQYSQNAIQKATDLWTKLRNIGFDFGNMILPVISGGLDILAGILTVVEPVLSGVTSLFGWWFGQLSEGNPLIWALSTAIAGTTVALNAATIATQAKVIWDGAVAVSTKVWAAAQWLLNSAFWACPLTWIVAGVAALAGIIAMCVTKVTGWGKQWDVVVTFMGNAFDLFCETFSFRWNLLTNGFMIGLDKIRLGWYKFKEAVGMGDSAENKAMILGISGDVEKRKQAIMDGAKRLKELASKTADSLTWELSWKQGESQAEAAAGSSTPGSGFIPNVKTIDYDALSKSLNKSGKGKNGSTTKIDLGDTVANMKGTGSYAAIAAKLNPVNLASLSAKVAATAAIPALIAAGTPQATPVQPFDPAKTEYQSTKPLPVDVVSLSGSVISRLPQFSYPESVSMDAGGGLADSDMYPGEGAIGRGVHVDRFCDQVVIHIANADGKGYSQIREEVERVMMEVLDDYGA